MTSCTLGEPGENDAMPCLCAQADTVEGLKFMGLQFANYE